MVTMVFIVLSGKCKVESGKCKVKKFSTFHFLLSTFYFLQFERAAAVAAFEEAEGIGGDGSAAAGADEGDGFCDFADFGFGLTGQHVGLKIAEIAPSAGDEAHGVIDGALLILNVEDFFCTDGLRPLFIDGVALRAGRAA